MTEAFVQYTRLDIDNIPEEYPATGKLQSKGGWAHPNLAHPDGTTNDERIANFEHQVQQFNIHRRVRDAVILTFWPRAKHDDLDTRWLGLLKEFGIPTVLKTIDDVINTGTYGNPDALRPDYDYDEDEEDEDKEEPNNAARLDGARTWADRLKREDGMNSRSELSEKRAKRLAKRADRRNSDRTKKAKARKIATQTQVRG